MNLTKKHYITKHTTYYSIVIDIIDISNSVRTWYCEIIEFRWQFGEDEVGRNIINNYENKFELNVLDHVFKQFLREEALISSLNHFASLGYATLVYAIKYAAKTYKKNMFVFDRQWSDKVTCSSLSSAPLIGGPLRRRWHPSCVRSEGNFPISLALCVHVLHGSRQSTQFPRRLFFCTLTG